MNDGEIVDKEVARRPGPLNSGDTIVVALRAENAGTETITVKGKTYVARRIIGVVASESIGTTFPIEIREEFEVAWIDELKMFGRYETTNNLNRVRQRELLTDFSVQ